MSIHVFDACALLASVRGEKGAGVTEDLLNDPANQCVVHAVNLCEVYYDALRRVNVTVAEQAVNALLTLNLQLRADMDDAFWRQVGQFKVSPGKMSLADCFALALSVRMDATLVTSDREFGPAAALGLCPVLFIR